MPSTVETTPRDRLLLLAREAMTATPDLDAAIAALVKQAKADPAVWREMMQPHEAMAARQLLGGIMRANRSAIWNNSIGGTTADRQAKFGPRESAKVRAPAAPFTRPTAPDARVARLVTGMNRVGLLAFPLSSGRKLAEATGSEVAADAAQYAMKSKDMAWKARWLSAIAARVGSKTVGQVLSEDDLAKMKEAANA